jgi:hypothetical protein
MNPKGGTRNAEFFRQAPLRRQQLPGLEHAVDDQPLDALTDHVGDLQATARSCVVHATSNWYDQLSRPTHYR